MLKRLNTFIYIIILIWFTPLFAQWDAGVVLCDSNVHASKSCKGIVPDGEGGYICVWIDDREGGRGIYAQRVDSLGYIMYDTNGVHILQSTRAAKIVSDGEGGFFILYGNDSCYAQRIDKNLNKLWGEEGLYIYPSSAGSFDRIIFDNRNIFILLGRTSGWCHKINLTGEPVWPSRITVSDSSYSCFGGALRGVSNDKGGLIVIFSDDGWNINLQIIDSLGNRQLGDFGVRIAQTHIEPWGGNYNGENIIPDDSGGAFIAWSKNFYYPKMQHIDSLGNFLWGADGKHIVDTLGTRYGTHSIWLLKMRTDCFVSVLSYGRIKQKISYFGDTLWGGEGTFYSPLPSMTWDYFDAYIDNQNGFYVQYIMPGDQIQRFDSLGEPIWSEPITFSDTNLSYVHVEEDGQLVFVCHHFNILALIRISPDGYVLDINENYSSNDFKKPSLTLNNYPNPFNSNTKICIETEKDNEKIDLNISNLLGQSVKEIYSGYVNIGKTELTWNGKDNNNTEVPSGIYLVSVESKNNKYVKKIVKLN